MTEGLTWTIVLGMRMEGTEPLMLLTPAVMKTISEFETSKCGPISVDVVVDAIVKAGAQNCNEIFTWLAKLSNTNPRALQLLLQFGRGLKKSNVPVGFEHALIQGVQLTSEEIKMLFSAEQLKKLATTEDGPFRCLCFEEIANMVLENGHHQKPELHAWLARLGQTNPHAKTLLVQLQDLGKCTTAVGIKMALMKCFRFTLEEIHALLPDDELEKLKSRGLGGKLTFIDVYNIIQSAGNLEKPEMKTWLQKLSENEFAQQILAILFPEIITGYTHVMKVLQHTFLLTRDEIFLLLPADAIQCLKELLKKQGCLQIDDIYREIYDAETHTKPEIKTWLKRMENNHSARRLLKSLSVEDLGSPDMFAILLTVRMNVQEQDALLSLACLEELQKIYYAQKYLSWRDVFKVVNNSPNGNAVKTRPEMKTWLKKHNMDPGARQLLADMTAMRMVVEPVVVSESDVKEFMVMNGEHKRNYWYDRTNEKRVELFRKMSPQQKWMSMVQIWEGKLFGDVLKMFTQEDINQLEFLTTPAELWIMMEEEADPRVAYQEMKVTMSRWNKQVLIQ